MFLLIFGTSNLLSSLLQTSAAAALKTAKPFRTMHVEGRRSGVCMAAGRPSRWSVRLRAVCALAAGMLALRVSATTVLAPEFTDLVNGSDYIVHAMVKAVSSEKQPSSRGTKIVTHVALQIVDVIAGTPPSEVTLQLLGGRVGDEEVTVGGMPQFKAGDEDILFVAGNGHTICPLYGMMHGRFRVMTDGATGRRYVTRHNGAPLQNTGEIATGTDESAAPHGRALSLSALTPDEFVRQIRGARGSNVRSSQSK